jgi:hypothetical protein
VQSSVPSPKTPLCSVSEKVRDREGALTPAGAGRGPACSPKKSKKSLARAIGIVKNGVILRAFGGYMRKLKLRPILILGAAFMLFAAFTSRANATLIRYYNFEAPGAPYGVNLDSQTPAVETGHPLTLDNGIPAPNVNTYPPGNTSVQPGLPLNVPSGAPPNITSLGFDRSGQSPLGVEIQMPSAQGIYDVTSVSFAYGSAGNGWSAVQLQMSTNGGVTFNINLSGVIPLGATPGTVITFTIPPGTTGGISNLALRILFTGGQSNGADLQFELDNIQVNGTIVPEPATVAGGLLGVLGLCWFQRKKLIRSVRFRRT